MTLPSAVSRWEYAGNGSTTAFDYTSKIQDEDDLKVYLVSSAGVATLQTITTHYTVAKVNVAGGGKVTFVTAPAADETVVIVREPAFTQTTKIKNQGAFNPELHEDAFDHLAGLSQSLRDSARRAIRAPVQEDPDNLDFELPVIANRANKYLVFDADGNPGTSAGTGADSGLRADLASTDPTEGAALVGIEDADANFTADNVEGALSELHEFTQAGTGAITRSKQDKQREIISVDDFGAEGDGTTDDSAAIQAAIDHAGSLGGGYVLFGNGKTYIAEGLTPVDDVTLMGRAIIRPPATPSDHVISYAGAAAITNFNVLDLEFHGRGTGLSYDAIHISRATPTDSDRSWRHSAVERVYIHGFRNGVYSSCPEAVTFNSCLIDENKNGVAWDWEHFYLMHCYIGHNEVGLLVGQGSPTGTGAHHFRVTGTAIAHNSVAGVRGNMSSASLTACSLIDNGTAHFYVDTSMFNIRLTGCRLEGGTATNYAIYAPSPSVASRWVASNNTFLSQTVSDIYGILRASSFSNNLFRLTTERCVDLQSDTCNDNIFTANQFNECGKEAFNIGGNVIGLVVDNNSFQDCGTSSAGTYDAITTGAAVSIQASSISRNVFRNTSATQYINAAADLTGATTQTQNKMKDNVCRNLAADPTFVVTGSQVLDGSLACSGNEGFVTRNYGTATILSGNTAVVVDHGLDVNPSTAPTRIRITPAENIGARSFYVDSFTSTQFTLNVDSATAADYTFSWEIHVEK